MIFNALIPHEEVEDRIVKEEKERKGGGEKKVVLESVSIELKARETM